MCRLILLVGTVGLIPITETQLHAEGPSVIRGPARLITARTQSQPYIDWLPADSETLIVSTTKHVIAHEPPPQTRMRIYAIRMLLYLAFDKKQTALFYGKTIKTYVEGTREFRAPPSMRLGQLLYKGCHILVFDEPLGDTTEALISSLKRKGAKKHQIAGHAVWRHIPRHHKYASDYKPWICIPKDDVLLMALDERSIRQVLDRMQRPAKPVAFPETLPEWSSIDPASRFWGIRRFSKEVHPRDLSDPRLTVKDEVRTATGMSFHFGAAKPDAMVCFFGCNEPMSTSVKYSFNNVISGGKNHRFTPGVRATVDEMGTTIIKVDFDVLGKRRGRLESVLQLKTGHALII